MSQPTYEQAKAVWEGMVHPTARSVSDALAAQGFKISWTSIARWRRQGWESSKTSIPRITTKKIKTKLAPAERDAMSIAVATPPDRKDVAEISAEMDILIGNTKDMPLDVLQERTRMALNVVLMRRMAAKADLMVMQPRDTAAFVVSMTDASKPLMTIPAAPATVQEPGRMIDITPNNPLTEAIDLFKRRTGIAA